MKRIIALLIALLTLVTLVSCSNAGGDYVITAGDTKLGTAVLYSQLYAFKNDFLQNYLGLTDDNSDIWPQDSPSGKGESVGDSLKRMALEDLVQFAWVVEYAKDNGAELTEDDIKELDEAIESTRSNFDTEEEYQEYMATLKFTDETLREYFEETFYYDKGFEMLISDGGEYEIADDAFDKFYEENYYTVKHIFINNVSKEDAEGNLTELTEDEKKAKNDKADSIYADLQNGESFDTLYMLSEDGMSSSYPDGLTFTEGMIDADYEDAVKELEIGEYAKVNGSNGGIYIITRLELSADGREEYDGYIKNAIYTEVQSQIYKDCKNGVEVNYDIVNSYNMEDINISK